MPSKFPMNDPQNIWKNQPTEAFKMSADQLRLRAQKLEGKARFAVLWRMVLHLVLFVFFARVVINVRQALPPVAWPVANLWCIRIGAALISVWIVFGAYWLYKAIWPKRVAPDAALNTTLQYYLTELGRQRSFYRPSWRKMMPGFVGIALALVPILINEYKVAPQGFLANAIAPLVVLVALWAICLVMLGRRRQKLQHEIEQLSAFERDLS